MQLVTGYTGTKHVSAQDDSIRNVMLGEFNGRGVFPILEEFDATAVTANEVRVRSGYGINQGRLFKIDRNDYDSCTIENGAAGYKRVDLIVARYLKNEQTGIESCELAVIKGTPNANTYVDPSYTKGTLIDGALQDDMPMYRVKLDGVTIQPLEPMFKVYRSLIGGAEDLIDQMVDDNFDDKMGANQARFDNMISTDHTAYTSQKNSDHQAYQTMMTENDDAFDEWFAQVQAYLDEDTATKLTNASVAHNNALKQMTGYGTDVAGNVNSLGVLPINKGGTGQTSLQATRNAMGLGDTTGALPIANGGTGATTVASARNNLGLGNTSGALPVANGGTGQTNLAEAAVALTQIMVYQLSDWRPASGYTYRDLRVSRPSSWKIGGTAPSQSSVINISFSLGSNTINNNNRYSIVDKGSFYDTTGTAYIGVLDVNPSQSYAETINIVWLACTRQG